MANPVSYSNWMAGVSDDVNLASLALPGTHNSGANYISLDNNIDIARILRPSVPDLPLGLDEKLLDALGKLDPLIDAVVGLYALNQESTISEQLSNGIRYLDIRFNYDQANDRMLIAHGAVSYGELDLAIQEIEAWLAANPTETVLLKPRIYSGHSDALMKQYFHDRYVYHNQASPKPALRTFTEEELANNPFADDHAKQTPLIGESIFWLGDQLPSLSEARGKIVLLDAGMIASLKRAGLWGTEQDVWDTSSLSGGIEDKINLIANAIVRIAKDNPNQLVQNHFQLSPGAPRFDEILPNSLAGWYELAKRAINSPEKLLYQLLQRVFTPLTPPIGLAAQLNSAALELLKDLPAEQRTRGLWVGDFTDGSTDFVDQGLAAITSFLGLPADTSKLSTAERVKANLLLSITEQLRKDGQLQAANVTPEILRQNLGAVVSFSNKLVQEGGSTELRINWFNPAISNVFFELTPSSPGAATDDLLIAGNEQSNTGYLVGESNGRWQGNVNRGASGYLTIYGLANKDTEEIPESFSLQLYRDELRQQKLGESVSFTITPGTGDSSAAQTAYTITTEIANAPWAGSGDEGSTAFRAASSIKLIIAGLDRNGNAISDEIELSAKTYNRAINSNRPLPFQRGATDRFNVLLDQRFESISSASIQASNADQDFIDLKSLAINRINPLRDPASQRQVEPLFTVHFERDAVKVEIQNENSSATSQYLYKTGLTNEGAYRINSTQTTSFEVLPYLGGSNDKVATSKGDMWFHVLDQHGERTPISETRLNLDLPTFIITHGFTGGSGDNWLAGKLPSFSPTAPDWKLNNDDLLQWEAFYGDDHALGLSVQEAYRDSNGKIQANVVLADWGNFSAIGSGGASYASYAKVSEEHVPAAGRAIADYIKKQGIDPGKVTLLGHSLGGHVVGIAGQEVQNDVRNNPAAYLGKGQEVATIVAMDPAGPLFETWAPHKRLSNGDAGQVIAIHTDSLMGFDAPLGSHDLYMNAYYAVAHNAPGINAGVFQSALEEIYTSAQALYSKGDEQMAYASYLAAGLRLTWDPAFTWYLLKTENNPEDGRQWFQKQHNYSMATLANLFLEDKRLKDPTFVLPSWLGGRDPNTKDPTASGWSQTFKTQLDDFRKRNDEIAALEDGVPATFSSLIAGHGEGGLFSGDQPLRWFSGEGSNQAWQKFPYTFLKPDTKFQSDVNIPFSDYAYFWNDTGKNLADLALAEVSKLLAGKESTISQLISGIESIGDIDLSQISTWGGLDFYNRLLSPDFGFADGSGISLGGTSVPDIGGAALLSKVSNAYTAGYNSYNTISSWINTIYGLKQKVFGGPVVNGEVVFDLRTYNNSGSTLARNLNLTSDSGEVSTRTDSTGAFSLGNLPDPNSIGNRDGILDYRDGLVIAGSRDSNGSISVLDSISGSTYGFPLVGLPGGNITLLTTLKYATLLRWTPASTLLGQELSPDLITQLFAQIIKDVPRAFLDDSFNPYAALSSSDPLERQEGVDSLAFAYEHLAVIKLITELLKPSSVPGESSDAGGFGLIYGDNSSGALALWGRVSSDPLDPAGVDRAELVAFTAYGLAIQQSFTAERPFDPGDAGHLREVLVNLLSNYPTEALLKGQSPEFIQQFALAQTPEGRAAAREAVREAIEARLGTTLTNLSTGLSIINDVLQDRFSDAAYLSEAIPSVGTQLLIPTMAGPKRFMADTLSNELVRLARQSTDQPPFLDAFNKLLFTPLTIDDPQRQPTFKLAVTTATGKSVSTLTGKDPTARFSVTITDANGKPQPAPDYGLAVRFRLGGNAVEGLDYAVGDNLQHRLLSFAPGASETTIELPINPQALLRGNAVLQLELLSADSGYGVDANRAVASVVLGPRATEAKQLQLTGQRTAFVPHALITSAASPDEVAVLTATADQKNAILRGRDGRKDSFVIGGLYQGLPHIENFNPSDGDQVLIDAAVWADNTEITLSREQLGQVVNTYAGYVFDLLSGRPLALISQYDATTGDRAWTGLSSDQRAPYFDLAPAGVSAGVAIAGRSFVRGSAAEIVLASDINRLLNTDAALELIAISNNGERQVVMTLPGLGAGVPDGFAGHQRQTGLIGRLKDNADAYSFALRNLATGQSTPLSADKPSPAEQISNNTAFVLRDKQGRVIATVSTFSEADGSKPQDFTEELVNPAFGSDPVIGISLSGLGTALNDTARVLHVQMDVFREAAFNNRLGLYLADRQTLAPLDKLTGLPVSLPAAQALRQPGSIAGWLGDVVAPGASRIEASIAIPDAADATNIALLPYLVAGDSSKTVMLPASTLNPQRESQLRLLGLNTFGFEDCYGASSDWDYDDVIAKVSSIDLTTAPMA